MKLNKQEITNLWLSVPSKDFTKLPVDNVVFRKLEGLLLKIFRICVKTKEQPNGCIYEDNYQVVMRYLDGVGLINGMVDCYAWSSSKVESAKNKRYIGFSLRGYRNLRNFLATIKDKTERKMFKDMVYIFRHDLLLIHTDAEDRKCIEVTQELYDSGMTHCVDEWMKTDENGMADATELNVGDYLVVSNNGVYCIRHEEFMLTHRAN